MVPVELQRRRRRFANRVVAHPILLTRFGTSHGKTHPAPGGFFGSAPLASYAPPNGAQSDSLSCSFPVRSAFT